MVTRKRKQAASSQSSTASSTIAPELDEAAKRGPTTQQFAQQLSIALARKVANALRRDFKGILPDLHGKKSESLARTSKGVKRLDVNYSTTLLGLALGVSIKTTNAPEGVRNNYAKNVSGRDGELRAEAEDYHERQPYAVLIALYFVPIDSCDNATRRAPSSFGKIAMTLRFRSGRKGPKDLTTLFEAAFIGLYVKEGAQRGKVEFFDVMLDPPRSGRPSGTLTFGEVIERVKAIYDARNVTFKFADSPEPVTESGVETAEQAGAEDDT